MHMANIGAALKKLPAGIADEVKLVFLTTDPARDTPLVLRRWLDLLDRRFIGLTGTERAIEAVLPAARFLQPQERDRPTATTEWHTPILFLVISKIAKITSRMSSILAGCVRMIGCTTWLS
jgi:cytochrome oxidase Cu insertion factor (SCO1/SenC/PrrC family)